MGKVPGQNVCGTPCPLCPIPTSMNWHQTCLKQSWNFWIAGYRVGGQCGNVLSLTLVKVSCWCMRFVSAVSSHFRCLNLTLGWILQINQKEQSCIPGFWTPTRKIILDRKNVIKAYYQDTENEIGFRVLLIESCLASRSLPNSWVLPDYFYIHFPWQ